MPQRLCCRDPAGSFCREKKHLSVCEQGQGFGGREQRGDCFSETRRSLRKEMPSVADRPVNASRQFSLATTESLKGKFELFERVIAQRNPLRLDLKPVEPGADGVFKKLFQLRTSKAEGKDSLSVRFQIQIGQMQINLRPVALDGENRGVDFQLCQMQRVGGTIPKPIDAFDLLHHRRGMACTKPVNPASQREVHISASGFPLHRHFSLVVPGASTLHAPVGTPALKRTVRCAECAGAREAAPAVHKGDKFPHGSLEDDRCHG